MIELTDRDFQALCGDERIRRIVDAADRSGRRAALAFWSIWIGGLILSGGAAAWLIGQGWQVTGVLVGSVGMVAAYVFAALPLAMAGRAIKLPVYEILAARHGLAYAPLVEEPLFFAGARPALFGAEPGVESFTDYFQGKLLDAADFMTCQAYLLPERGGRFNGRFFAFGRSHVAGAEERCAPSEAEVRRLLAGLGHRGKVRLHAGPDAVFVALEGRKGFTPGLGFHFRHGEERVRAMFDDLADSLALLSRLKAAFDRGP